MKTSLCFTLAVAAGLLTVGCGGNGGGNSNGSATGLPLTPGAYYNLVPGLCAEYSNDAGGTGPTIGVHIQSATNPPGIELRRTRHGATDENDFLSFAPDGGGVFLAEREYLSSAQSMVAEVYATPLSYLPAPQLSSQTLDSTSVCNPDSACTTMKLDVSVASSNPYTGANSVPDGGMIETHLNFIFEYDNDGGAQSLVERALVPGIGFTDLYLPDDTGTYTDYLLVDIIPDDGGVCAEH